MYRDGKIYIELADNQIFFQAGDIIKGKVHVDYTDAYDHIKGSYTNLELQIIGAESTNVTRQHTRKEGKRTVHYSKQHPGAKEFYNRKYTICFDLCH